MLGPRKEPTSRPLFISTVKGMGTKANSKEERENGPPQTVEVNRGRGCGSQDNVAQMPDSEGNVQQGYVVAPTTCG